MLRLVEKRTDDDIKSNSEAIVYNDRILASYTIS